MPIMLEHRPSQMDSDEYLEFYGGIYEHSPWIAERAFSCQSDVRDIDNVEALYNAMKEAVANGTYEQKLLLISAHPDLACAPAGIDKLSVSSTSEQKGAGLDQCSQEEFEKFQWLNAAYHKKFRFPFIIAVKGLSRQDILTAFMERIQNDINEEFETALIQIDKIAWLRLEQQGEKHDCRPKTTGSTPD